MEVGSLHRAQADHPAAADQARQQPAVWVLAGLYSSSQSAQATARAIQHGSRAFPDYTPFAQFEAYAVPSGTGCALWVRYMPKVWPADVTAGPAALIRAAASGRQYMHAMQAAALLSEHGYECAAELVLAELGKRGDMSAQQAAEHLVELHLPAASVRMHPTPKDYA